jgi:hypothetical protein
MLVYEHTNNVYKHSEITKFLEKLSVSELVKKFVIVTEPIGNCHIHEIPSQSHVHCQMIQVLILTPYLIKSF